MKLDKLKSVYRQTMVKSDNSRQENSAEHSWHIAMMATLLSDYVSEPVNTQRVVTMLLIHDIVEIDAGDAFVFDAEQVAGQEDKEIKAAERLFGLLPESQHDYLMELWQEFETLETPRCTIRQSDGLYAAPASEYGQQGWQLGKA